VIALAAVAASAAEIQTRLARRFSSDELLSAPTIPVLFIERAAVAASCPAGKTCCSNAQNQLELCPYSGGVCCGNSGFCCSQGSKCSANSGHPDCLGEEVNQQQEQQPQAAAPQQDAAPKPQKKVEHDTIVVSNGNKVTQINRAK
jgi:hypothetical protein